MDYFYVIALVSLLYNIAFHGKGKDIVLLFLYTRYCH